MKKMIAVLATLLTTTVAFADQVVIATNLPSQSDDTVQSFFNFKTKTETAWVQIHVGEWFGDAYNWEKARIIPVSGLSYDADSRLVLYTKNNGDVVVCGKKNIFSANHLKLTGLCQLNHVVDGDSLSVVLNVK